jgi:hypothetical protein
MKQQLRFIIVVRTGYSFGDFNKAPEGANGWVFIFAASRMMLPCLALPRDCL